MIAIIVIAVVVGLIVALFVWAHRRKVVATTCATLAADIMNPKTDGGGPRALKNFYLFHSFQAQRRNYAITDNDIGYNHRTLVRQAYQSFCTYMTHCRNQCAELKERILDARSLTGDEYFQVVTEACREFERAQLNLATLEVEASVFYKEFIVNIDQDLQTLPRHLKFAKH